MYIIFVLMLTGVKESGSATLSFVFPNSGESESLKVEEKIRESAMRVDGVREDDGSLEIDLVSRDRIECDFNVLYDDGSVESYSGCCVDGFQTLEVPVVLSGSRRKIRWVNILWEGDGLVVCNASYDNLPDLSCTSAGQFEKN